MQSHWSEWYKKKGYKVEPEIPGIEKLLKGRKEANILDIGCGHGRHLLWFAARGYHLYGIDSYPVVLRQLRGELKRNGLRAELKLRDFRKRLPYPDGYFDAVLATRAIHHAGMGDVRGIFSEIRRVLRKDGILFLQVPSYEEAKKYEKRQLELEKPLMHKWVEPHTFMPLGGDEKGVWHHAFDRKELNGFLKGYRVINMHMVAEHYHGYCVVAERL